MIQQLWLWIMSYLWGHFQLQAYYHIQGPHIPMYGYVWQLLPSFYNIFHLNCFGKDVICSKKASQLKRLHEATHFAIGCQKWDEDTRGASVTHSTFVDPEVVYATCDAPDKNMSDWMVNVSSFLYSFYKRILFLNLHTHTHIYIYMNYNTHNHTHIYIYI